MLNEMQSNVQSHIIRYVKMILNRLFLSNEYEQYLKFSVEITTNTLITKYSKHLWGDRKNPLINLSNYFIIVEKGIEQLLSYLTQKVLHLKK